MRRGCFWRLRLKQEGLSELEYQQRLDSLISEQSRLRPNEPQESGVASTIIQVWRAWTARRILRSEMNWWVKMPRKGLKSSTNKELILRGLFEIYLAERKDILDDAGYHKSNDKRQSRNSGVAHFPSKQIRRVEAIERIWDARAWVVRFVQWKSLWIKKPVTSDWFFTKARLFRL